MTEVLYMSIWLTGTFEEKICKDCSNLKKFSNLVEVVVTLAAFLDSYF